MSARSSSLLAASAPDAEGDPDGSDNLILCNSNGTSSSVEVNHDLRDLRWEKTMASCGHDWVSG